MALGEDRGFQSRSRINLVPIEQDRIGRIRVKMPSFERVKYCFPKARRSCRKLNENSSVTRTAIWMISLIALALLLNMVEPAMILR